MSINDKAGNAENTSPAQMPYKVSQKSNLQNTGKRLLAGGVLAGLFMGIVGIFYYQEIQYLLPTPVPENYRSMPVGQLIRISNHVPVNFNKPVVLHFFNPQCPCSRFNMDHVQRLIRKYEQQFNFYAVLQAEDGAGAAENFRSKYDLAIPVILDTDKQIAAACGVYATPQAVILNKQGELYYRGNYNKARYCTDPRSNYAQMAMDSLLAAKPAPVFVELATQAYGCELPDPSVQADIFSSFNF
jgi:hypothetical protein